MYKRGIIPRLGVRSQFKVPKPGGGGARTQHIEEEVQLGSPARQHATISPVSNVEEMKQLMAEEIVLDDKIKKLQDQNVKVETLQVYVRCLHEYNETKDVAQMLMGRIAVHEGLPTRSIAQRYNAPDN